ncbi:MAG: DUF1801 domain-containing protein [Planctomycetaceae bacterium]|nr:MAG: DUF1801 domain-containing protein [Planctomycetaceae bacterium]
MQSSAKTVADYLASLPEERRTAISAIRDVILANLDSDFEEGMGYGMISYHVPHRVYPPGYHCNPKDPLPYVCLASQKNHMAVYLMSVYGDPKLLAWFTDAWKKTGKKLDMGKSCLRFKKLDDVALEVLGETIRRVPAGKYIAQYEALLKPSGSRTSGTAASAKTKSSGKQPKAAGGKQPAKPRKTGAAGQSKQPSKKSGAARKRP